MKAHLERVKFSQVPGWTNATMRKAFFAFKLCAKYQKNNKPYRVGTLGVKLSDFTDSYNQALLMVEPTESEAKAFFETHFQPFKISDTQSNSGFVTGYYEPELDVSRKYSDKYCWPIYKRPRDLIDIKDQPRPKGLDPYFEYGFFDGLGLREYADRQKIDQGFLKKKGLEIAFAKNRVDLFFVHIQGAARLNFEDGDKSRITFAAKTGHRFTGIGGYLVENGLLEAASVTMATIREWLAKNPSKMDEVLWKNRSYIFFRETELLASDQGPIAAAKAPLTSLSSLAVDRQIHTFSTPFFINAPSITHIENKPFQRLMIAQDTGSAIVGAARGDIFTGSGRSAGNLAGCIKNNADFYCLLPHLAAKRYYEKTV